MYMESPNIIWITIDSVRADHTSLHGYHRDTTPEIDRISSSPAGVQFTHGISQGIATHKVIPCIMTGLYPSRHQMIGENWRSAIPDSMITAPELFNNCGYQTICISENDWAGSAKGLDERFNEYVSPPPSLPPSSRSSAHILLKYLFNVRKHGPGFTLDKDRHAHQKSFFTTEYAKKKLNNKENRNRPIFLYVHFNDPHYPYRPPLSYVEEYTEDIAESSESALEFAQKAASNMYEHMANGVPFTDDQWDMLYAMYDATIKYTDYCIGRLFDFIQNNLSNTIVVITSDHGELFGEKGLIGHQYVTHNALVHIPLVTHGLDGVSKCADNPTQHIDIMQTLLDIVGANTQQFQGCNLLEECPEVAISQDLREEIDSDDIENYAKIRKYNHDIDLSHLPKSLITSVQTSEFKLNFTENRRELYKIGDETEDISNAYPKVYDNLLEFAEEWIVSEGKPLDAKLEEAELSTETKENLRDMGYLV
jgi:uncharacterized sulfatase